VAYVGVASMAAGYAVFFDLIRHHGAVGANQVTFLNPVVAVVLGVVAFGEPFAVEEVAGLALILIALALVHVPSPRSRRPGDQRFPPVAGEPRAEAGASATPVPPLEERRVKPGALSAQ